MTRELFRLAAGILLALLLAGSVAAADANNTTQAANQTPPAAWERTYGGLANESLLSLLGEAGGGYLLVGSAEGNGTGEELYLVRTDSNGTPTREQRMPFGPGGTGSPVMADRTADGGTIVTGGSGTVAAERRGRRPPPARARRAAALVAGRTRSAAAGTWATRCARRPTAGISWPGRRIRRTAGRPSSCC